MNINPASLEDAYENRDKFDEDIYMKWQETQNKDFKNFRNLSYPYFRYKYKQPTVGERNPTENNPFNNLLPTDYTSKNLDKTSQNLALSYHYLDGCF